MPSFSETSYSLVISSKLYEYYFISLANPVLIMTTVTSSSLQPIYFEHVVSTKNALVLFEACLNSTLSHVHWHPHYQERAQLIKSVCVFTHEENESGVKWWTDSVPWSLSWILRNFFIYCELLKPFLPGETPVLPTTANAGIWEEQHRDHHKWMALTTLRW